MVVLGRGAVSYERGIPVAHTEVVGRPTGTASDTSIYMVSMPVVRSNAGSISVVAEGMSDTYTLHPTPYTLHTKPHTPTPYTLHPTPYTLHPAPYTLHATPYTPHPTPYTLYLDPVLEGGALV